MSVRGNFVWSLGALLCRLLVCQCLGVAELLLRVHSLVQVDR